MSKALAQIWGIARCEFLIHWRRRGLKVVFLSYLVMQILCLLVKFGIPGSAGANQPASISAARLAANTDAVIFNTWIVEVIFMLVMFPLIVAETLPRDRQFGVRELLDSLPLSPFAYLSGKLLGAWISVAAGATVLVVGAGIAWRIVAGPYQLGPFLAMGLTGIGLLSVLNCGLAILAAAGQRNASRALLVGLACVVIVPLLLIPIGTTSPVQLLSPLRLPIFYYYLNLGGAGLPTFVWFGKSLSANTAFALTAVGGFVELAIAGIVARYTLKSGGEE